jgi:hypothetical protein
VNPNERKAPRSGSFVERGTIFPTFKVNVPMPSGTAPTRPTPPPTPLATDKPPGR